MDFDGGSNVVRHLAGHRPFDNLQLGGGQMKNIFDKTILVTSAIVGAIIVFLPAYFAMTAVKLIEECQDIYNGNDR